MKLKPLSITTDAFCLILACVVVVIVFVPLFLMNIPGTPISLYQQYINYCTDTPEGKAVISRMNDRFSRDQYKIWDNEDAVLAGMQEIDRVRIWATGSTTGDEQKAWLCWTDYFFKEYADRSKILHAQNTVKTPPK